MKRGEAHFEAGHHELGTESNQDEQNATFPAVMDGASFAEFGKPEERNLLRLAGSLVLIGSCVLTLVENRQAPTLTVLTIPPSAFPSLPLWLFPAAGNSSPKAPTWFSSLTLNA